MKLILVTGGVRSGKSGFAEEVSARAGESALYVATGVNTDKEMEARIQSHRDRRPSHWGCIETPYDLPMDVGVYQNYPVVLFDCFSTWVTNQMMRIPEGEMGKEKWTDAILQGVDDWLTAMESYEGIVVAVTSEVGLGGVAMSSLGRWFQDVQGAVNQKLGVKANEVYMVVSGIPWKVKGD
ncbi:MAG TPA: bifunctional adenosylcobinamide kinase/adenosylcobinamide-phosphate guanylyltransferase [Paenibacillaceae bacterium]|nr:bifunctional adenosylcobinamide kinase/adenosylcobinamide-phosphate guanylyltransferase [Paenibacillaceae bacterium]